MLPLRYSLAIEVSVASHTSLESAAASDGVDLVLGTSRDRSRARHVARHWALDTFYVRDRSWVLWQVSLEMAIVVVPAHHPLANPRQMGYLVLDA